MLMNVSFLISTIQETNMNLLLQELIQLNMVIMEYCINL